MRRFVPRIAIAVLIISTCLAALAGDPPPAPRYEEVIDREFNLTPFVKDAANWVAHDLFAAWNTWQRKLHADPSATLEPWDFYGDRFSFSVREGIGHGSDSALDIRYEVGPMMRDAPHAPPKNDIWSKCYTRKPLPVSVADYNRLQAWVYVEGMRSTTVPIGLEVDFDAMLEWYEQHQTPRRHRKYFVVTRMPVTGGQWNRIWLDFSELPMAFRERVRYITLVNFWHGVQPSDNHEEIHFLWDDVRLLHVANPRKTTGWSADPAVVTVNQLGYKPLSEKIALLPVGAAAETFMLRDAGTHEVVHRGSFKLRETMMGDFLEGDFSSFERPGRYYVQAAGVRSLSFPIADMPYGEVAEAMHDIVTGMRSGCATPLHEESHMDAVWDLENRRFVDLTGGHYDAGDLRIYTHSSMAVGQFSMDSYARVPPGDPLRAKLVDETRWSFLVLEKCYREFGEMVRLSRMAANRDGNWYTDNKPGTADDYILDRSSRKSFGSWILPGLQDLSIATRDSDPDLSARALALATRVHEQVKSRDLRSNLAMYRATGSTQYLAAAEAALTVALSQQQNRVIEGAQPAVSGMIAVHPGRTTYNSYPTDIFYGMQVAQLAEAMQQLPEHYYDCYFALRRYAECFVKPVTSMIGPYGMPGDIIVGDKERRRHDGMRLLGYIDDQEYFVQYVGGQTELAVRYPLPLMMVAAALGDTELEAIAQRCAGQMSGWNPYNFSFIHGFGEDCTSHVFALYPLTRGMMPRYLRLYRHSRTDAHEIWGRLQVAAVSSFVALNAPCVVDGTVTRAGTPVAGPVKVLSSTGRTVAEATAGDDGRFAATFSGGGGCRLEAGGVAREFGAVAGGHYTLDLDIAAEARIAGRRITGKVSNLVHVSGKDAIHHGMKPGWRYVKGRDVDTPFDGRPISLQAGDTYTLHVDVIGVGAEASGHTLAFHAANATVTPATLNVSLKAGETKTVEVELVAERGGETVCVLAELDDDHSRNWDFIAVATVNPSYLKSILLRDGKPLKYQPFELLSEDGAVLLTGRTETDGSVGRKPRDLGRGGTFRIRSGDHVTEPFTVAPRTLYDAPLQVLAPEKPSR